MAALLYAVTQRQLRRERIFRDRLNPLDFYDDVDLFDRYRMDRKNILTLVDIIGPSVERETSRSYSISTTIQVMVTLRFYATGCFQSLVGDIHGISVPTVSRIINSVSRTLAESNHPLLCIKFPQSVEEIALVKHEFHQVENFPNVLGRIDGTQIALRSPIRNESVFVCPKNFHSLNVQATCDAHLRFTSAFAKYPGSVHDSFVLHQSALPVKFNAGEFGESYLLGDSGYPLRPWLMIPFNNPETRGERRFNSSLKTTRCSIERAFGVAKSRFRCIHHKSGGCLMYSPDSSALIIIAVFKLHNYCVNQRVELVPIEPDDDADEKECDGSLHDGNTVRDALVRLRFT